ncbi:hypothetical protein RHA1_ro07094 [Rhodococcus jostii RHA1]|uniref:Uncharacterized protein n=1 Tax=Rhodococcus jostii (strain RHA1) TaxID=101510 RepID=Q0S0S8_RHOJR|nr:hypothetical protein RHA1_ro07094 [Rhodococcus jostii RHA1]
MRDDLSSLPSRVTADSRFSRRQCVVVVTATTGRTKRAWATHQTSASRAGLLPRRVVSRNVKSRPDGIRLAPSTLNHAQTDLNSQLGGGFSTFGLGDSPCWRRRWTINPRS